MSAISRLLTSNVSLLLEELPSASSQCEAANGDEFSQFLFHWKCLPSPPSLKDIFGGCRRLGWLWHYRCLDSDEKWLIIFIFVLHVSGVICFCCFLRFFFSNLIFNNHTGSWCGFLVCILLAAYWAPWNCWLTLCIKFGMFSASSSDIFFRLLSPYLWDSNNIDVSSLMFFHIIEALPIFFFLLAFLVNIFLSVL